MLLAALPLQFPIGDQGELPSLTTVAPAAAAAAAAAERVDGPADNDADEIGISATAIRRQGEEGRCTTKNGGRRLISEAAAARALAGDA